MHVLFIDELLLAQIVDELAHFVDRLNIVLELLHLALAVDLYVELWVIFVVGGCSGAHFLEHGSLDAEIFDLPQIIRVLQRFVHERQHSVLVILRHHVEEFQRLIEPMSSFLECLIDDGTG